jgi:hypothetical protein
VANITLNESHGTSFKVTTVISYTEVLIKSDYIYPVKIIAAYNLTQVNAGEYLREDMNMSVKMKIL